MQLFSLFALVLSLVDNFYPRSLSLAEVLAELANDAAPGGAAPLEHERGHEIKGVLEQGVSTAARSQTLAGESEGPQDAPQKELEGPVASFQVGASTRVNALGFSCGQGR